MLQDVRTGMGFLPSLRRPPARASVPEGGVSGEKSLRGWWGG